MTGINLQILNTQKILDLLAAELDRNPHLGFDELPSNPKFLWDYYLRLDITFLLIARMAYEIYPEQMVEGPDFPYPIPMVCSLAKKDVDRVIFPAAAAAWLMSGPDQRWAAKHLIKPVPEDLSYGLFLQYPIPLARGLAYFLGITRDEENRNLDEETLRSSQVCALQALQSVHFPDKSEEEILSAVYA